MGKKILIFAIAVLLTSCLREDSIKIPYEGLTPGKLDDGWEVCTPNEVGFDEQELSKVFEKFHTDNEAWQPRSLIVVKDGYLVGETYTKNRDDQTTPQAVWSCTKQVLSIIVMRAKEEGYISSPDVSLVEVMPEIVRKYPEKGGITLRNLLTMTSGIGFENSGLNGDTNKLLRREPENSVEYILSLPMVSNPGSNFNYSDGDPQIISAIISNATGESVYTWSKRRVFEPLNIRNYEWLTYPDGLTMGAFGLKLTARDLAKFGQLILNHGEWYGERIIGPESVEEIITPAVATNYMGQQFGLLWWINPEDGTPYMHGQGGQYVMIDRERKVVVCITSEPNTQGESQYSLSQAFEVFRSVLKTIENYCCPIKNFF